MNSPSAFQFQRFTIKQEHCAMKIGLDGVLLGAWCPVANSKKILDIGTGTGLLALMLAQRSEAEIHAIEIEHGAFAEAQANIAASPYKKQITVYHTSLQRYQTEDNYDLIISNPPYFNGTLLSHQEKRNTARHQTELSYEELIIHSKRLLSPQGQLVFILPSEATASISSLAEQHELFIQQSTLVEGKKGKKVKRCLFILQKTACKHTQHTLCIRDSHNKYTAEFKAITGAYYLPSIFR